MERSLTILSQSFCIVRLSKIEIATVHSERFKLALVLCILALTMKNINCNIQGQTGLALFIPKFEALMFYIAYLYNMYQLWSFQSLVKLCRILHNSCGVSKTIYKV